MCHKPWIKHYFKKYENAKPKQSIDQPIAWNSSNVINNIETGINKGTGYELSYVRDCINNKLWSNSKVTER